MKSIRRILLTIGSYTLVFATGAALAFGLTIRNAAQQGIAFRAIREVSVAYGSSVPSFSPSAPCIDADDRKTFPDFSTVAHLIAQRAQVGMMQDINKVSLVRRMQSEPARSLLSLEEYFAVVPRNLDDSINRTLLMREVVKIASAKATDLTSVTSAEEQTRWRKMLQMPLADNLRECLADDHRKYHSAFVPCLLAGMRTHPEPGDALLGFAQATEQDATDMGRFLSSPTQNGSAN